MRTAGTFGDWLRAMRAVLRGEQAADVPCGDCTGCCISAYPIPLRPDDRVALERVPDAFLTLATGAGTRAVMGYRPDGSCPLLDGGRCTIYRDRPQTCRDYDCRIYAATGLLPDGDRPAIRQRVGEWQFSHAGPADQAAADAVRRAAQFIHTHADLFPPGIRAGSATAAAVLALKAYPVFLDARTGDSAELVQRVLSAARAFDAGVC